MGEGRTTPSTPSNNRISRSNRAGDFVLFYNLKVLVVLAGGPVTAPLEACLSEELEAEIPVVDLIGEVPRTVGVGLASDRLYED